ncbi:hypothetical protein ONE63_001951 [Megalurothrips usitatus]|uniref:Uncharacterized protein n=1 Tax=Megalurothrips usitatus TaxID=439358 RepID=A0AAV7XEL4_9NEOP|nr:hypothetical protein ONE63_001951 [Megalurothrips usitatus]
MAHSVQDAFVIAVEQQARERLEKLSQLKRIKPVDMNKLTDTRPGSPSRPGPSRESSQSKESWNGIIDHNSVFVTSLVPAGPGSEGASTSAAPGASAPGASGAPGHEPTTPRLTNGHHGREGGGGAAAGGGNAGGPASGPPSQGASFDDTDAPEVELKQDLDAVVQQQQQQQQQQQREDRRASSPFTNGRTELLIGDHEGHRMRTTALVEHPSHPPTDEEWSVRYVPPTDDSHVAVFVQKTTPSL